MKKILTGLSITLFILVIAFTAMAQNDKKDNKKAQPQGNAKKQDKQPGKDKKAGNDNDQKNNDKNKGRDNNAKSNNGNDDGSDGKDKNKSSGKNNNGNDEDYSWNKENFKERKKLKNREKVTVCHKFNSNNEPGVTLNVSSNALKAHMNHGDVAGACPVIADNRFSDDYFRRRADYYNSLQNTQEQVIYSRSILDYALERLTNSRLQLATLRRNNVPVVEIQRKETVVVQLEQNVSLLEAALGVAANLVVKKLSN